MIFFSCKVKPTVLSAPQRQIQINVGETLTIQCSARGSPAPYINWRLNWGHICGDGSGNGRCTMTQAINDNDPTLVTGTLTVRNVNANDAGAYSCEALNNQGFIFAIPDAIVNVLIGLYFAKNYYRIKLTGFFIFVNRSSSCTTSSSL